MIWFGKPKWQCVGMLFIYPGHLGPYWMLEQRRDGRRRSRLVGATGGAAVPSDKHAAVETWAAGGDIPHDTITAADLVRLAESTLRCE